MHKRVERYNNEIYPVFMSIFIFIFKTLLIVSGNFKTKPCDFMLELTDKKAYFYVNITFLTRPGSSKKSCFL